VAKRNTAASTRPAIGRAEAPSGGGGGLSSVDGHATDATPAALDRLIHERIRLGIVSALAVNDSLSFNALKSLMGTTDGNLSVHARKLEDAGYIRCTKSFEGRLPKTDYAPTPLGPPALGPYPGPMETNTKNPPRRGKKPFFGGATAPGRGGEWIGGGGGGEGGGGGTGRRDAAGCTVLPPARGPRGSGGGCPTGGARLPPTAGTPPRTTPAGCGS